jgi:hypothetical protein
MTSMRDRLRGAGAATLIVAALSAIPIATATTANAAPTTTHSTAAPAASFQAADGWFYWHCIRWHEWWRPACHPHPGPWGPGPWGPGPWGPGPWGPRY